MELVELFGVRSTDLKENPASKMAKTSWKARVHEEVAHIGLARAFVEGLHGRNRSLAGMQNRVRSIVRRKSLNPKPRFRTLPPSLVSSRIGPDRVYGFLYRGVHALYSVPSAPE